MQSLSVKFKKYLTEKLSGILWQNNNSISMNLCHNFSAAEKKELVSGTTMLFHLDIVNFNKLEKKVTPAAFQSILYKIKKSLYTLIPVVLPFSTNKLLFIDHIVGDDFIILCSTNNNLSTAELENSTIALTLAFKEGMKAIFRATGWNFLVKIGFAPVVADTEQELNSLIYATFREAQKAGHTLLDPKKVELMVEFKEILHNKNITMLFQPIVSLTNGQIFGWEALARGPEKGYFFSPAVLFNFAEEVHMLYPLEKICREKALDTIGKLLPSQKLFLNVHPLTVSDPDFIKGETFLYLEALTLSANNIAFEITEQTDIKNIPDFNRTLQHYRQQGYSIAIDDVGSGFSGLNTIASLRPDYLKMDMHLVRNINHDSIKKTLMETFVIFAEKIGCKIIAEGIETENELDTLISLGVHYGQGFFLAKPSFPRPELTKEIRTKIFSSGTLTKGKFLGHTIPVGEVMEKNLTVSTETPVKNVQETLDKNNLAGLVIVEEKKPVGLIMEHNMYKLLSSQFGVSLYLNKPIGEMMDRQPLVVDIETSIQKVSQLAMSRDSSHLYDLIVIVKEDEYAGVLSVQTLLDVLNNIQIEFARKINPLTKLPGNNVIEEKVKTNLAAHKAFSLIYCDLDNFKAYNDKYGFSQGDKALLLTAKVLLFVAKKYNAAASFVGHVGGDDFVVITTSEHAETIAARIIKIFDRVIPRYYESADRAQGGIEGKDRQGLNKWFPLISLSLAIVTYDGQQASSLEKISSMSAELKKYAKKQAGSVYVTDRRN